MGDNGKSETTARLKQRFKLYTGLDGIPFRLFEGQEMPLLKDDDSDRHRPLEVYDGHVKIFDLGEPQQLAEYEKIIDDAAKGHTLISREEINWDSKKNSYIVFLRWLEVFLEKPRGGLKYEETVADTGH